jgi:hypothetical protein
MCLPLQGKIARGEFLFGDRFVVFATSVRGPRDHTPSEAKSGIVSQGLARC